MPNLKLMKPVAKQARNAIDNFREEFEKDYNIEYVVADLEVGVRIKGRLQIKMTPKVNQ